MLSCGVLQHAHHQTDAVCAGAGVLLLGGGGGGRGGDAVLPRLDGHQLAGEHGRVDVDGHKLS